MKKTARLSRCGNYRWTLTRTWDDRPKMVVCMFNPSIADASVDDSTVDLLCEILSHNGYGGMIVVNGIPLRSSEPGPARAMCDWEENQDKAARNKLRMNLRIITAEISKAGSVLIAWGALASNCSDWFDEVRQAVKNALPEGVPVYCLGRTKAGYPKHPMARGKHKVPKDAPLLHWVETN